MTLELQSTRCFLLRGLCWDRSNLGNDPLSLSEKLTPRTLGLWVQPIVWMLQWSSGIFPVLVELIRLQGVSRKSLQWYACHCKARDGWSPRKKIKKESTCQCRRHRFNPWSKKIPCTKQQLSPEPQLLSLCSRDCEPYLLSPSTAATESYTPWSPALQQERPPQWEACALHLESNPTHHNQRKSPHSNKDPTQPKK